MTHGVGKTFECGRCTSVFAVEETEGYIVLIMLKHQRLGPIMQRYHTSQKRNHNISQNRNHNISGTNVNSANLPSFLLLVAQFTKGPTQMRNSSNANYVHLPFQI